jgi:hypothetical protein
MSERAHKIWEAFKKELTQPATDDMREALATAIRELNTLCSESLPSNQEVDEFYGRLYGSNDYVVYSDEIEKVVNELEEL